jgi:hypothetical protein
VLAQLQDKQQLAVYCIQAQHLARAGSKRCHCYHMHWGLPELDNQLLAIGHMNYHQRKGWTLFEQV